jgi:DNA repair photolyase
MSLVVDGPAKQAAAAAQRTQPRMDARVGLWSSPAVIAPNNFVYKSLSNWAFNIAVGCSHACRF